jgi:hypothetical protein
MEPTGNRIPSKASVRLSKGHRVSGGPVHPQSDSEALQGLTEEQEREMAGGLVINTPNDIKILRIPFSTEEHVRGQFQ